PPARGQPPAELVLPPVHRAGRAGDQQHRRVAGLAERLHTQVDAVRRHHGLAAHPAPSDRVDRILPDPPGSSLATAGEGAGAERSRWPRTISATATAMTTAASTVRDPSGSSSSHQPSSTATTGFTNAYVPAMRAGALRSNHS